MGEQTNRYPPDPLNGAALFKEELADINRRISALEGAPLVGSNFTALDLAGAIRVVAGHLPDDTYGMEIDGGKVRALDIDLKTNFSQNVTTITTLAQNVLSVAFVPPAWAVHALVFGWASIQITDTSGAASQLLTGLMTIDGTAGGSVSLGLTDVGQTGSVTPLFARALAAPLAASLTVNAQAYLAHDTNAANRLNLSALAIYTR